MKKNDRLMRYTAINIGPIVGTIILARKPRELWSASYLFSLLMECIIDKLKATGKNILSPASIDVVYNPYKKVGLYPDRVFVEGIKDDEEIENIVVDALDEFTKVTGIDRDYVNIMYVSIESETGKDVIKNLNYYLDCVELVNRPISDNSRVAVLNLIQEKNNSALFKHASGDINWNIPFFAEIATHKLSKIEGNKALLWMKYRDEECAPEKENEGLENTEDEFYQKIKSTFKEEYRSYYKYICVVQADGDNMGRIVSALDMGKVEDLSTALLEYGSTASRMIEQYGGLPIYAGGDDLLFIAPVISDTEYEIEENGEDNKKKVDNIFELLEAIDAGYKSKVGKKVEELWKGKQEPVIHTSMSYGLSISYYKYPLYEALNTARELLFDTAKKVSNKNAVAWCLRKHSGSSFVGAFSKNTLPGSVYTLFKELMKCSADEALVSAIAHKLRTHEDLLTILRYADRYRIDAFYQKIMEESTADDKSYVGTTRRLFVALLDSYAKLKDKDEDKEMSKILKQMYGMLRTAKFINGEGDIDE